MPSIVDGSIAIMSKTGIGMQRGFSACPGASRAYLNRAHPVGDAYCAINTNNLDFVQLPTPIGSCTGASPFDLCP